MSSTKLFTTLAILLLVALSIWSYALYRSFGGGEKEVKVVQSGVPRSQGDEKPVQEETQEPPENTGPPENQPTNPNVATEGEAPSPEVREAPPTVGTSEIVLKEGFDFIEKRELPQAEEFFLQHLKLYPLDPEGHYGLGSVYRLEEDFDQSVEEFAKTLLLKPDHIQAKYQLAEMLAFQTRDDYESAEKLYQEILEQVPEEKSAVNGLATVYLQTGRVDSAIDLWEDLRQELPEQEAISKNLGNAYYIKSKQETEAGNTDQAGQFLSKALELNPDVAKEEK